jgi:hypothetical protein
MKKELDNAKSFSIQLGEATVGAMVGHAIPTFAKQDTPVVNGGLLLASVVAASMTDNKHVKGVALGVGVVAGLKLVKEVAKKVYPLQGVNGMDGMADTIHKLIPTLGTTDTEDMSGYDDMPVTIGEYVDAEPVGDYRQISGTESLIPTMGAASTPISLLSL